jgi:putative oxidoreductase
MSLVRRLARPLLAAPFVYGGIDQLRKPAAKVDGGGPIIPALKGLAVGPVTLPSDDAGLVRLNGALMTTAGLALALGKAPRASSAVLAASLVPTTLTGHRFWEAPDAKTRQLQLVQALKNAALFGGLLIAAVDLDGKPGLAWRAQHAAKTTQRSAKVATRAGTAVAKRAQKKAAKSAGRAQKKLHRALD